ncbi:hypothetical protein Tco_0507630 [Tanacetum coccineum]
MDASKHRSLPMQPNVDLSKTQGPSTPNEVKRMKRVPYDLVVDMFLVYGNDSVTELSGTCYTDDGWETDLDDIRSQTRYVFVMNGGVVNWKSPKQSTTAMSSTEAEYIATMEAICIHKFISRLCVVPNNDRLMDMYYDNTSVITINKLEFKRMDWVGCEKEEWVQWVNFVEVFVVGLEQWIEEMDFLILVNGGIVRASVVSIVTMGLSCDGFAVEGFSFEVSGGNGSGGGGMCLSMVVVINHRVKDGKTTRDLVLFFWREI